MDMRKGYVRGAILVFLLAAANAAAQGNADEAPARRGRSFGKGNPFTMEQLPPGKLKAKLQQLPPQARGRAMQWLHTFTFPDFDAELYLRVDNEGGVYYVCADEHGNLDGEKLDNSSLHKCGLGCGHSEEPAAAEAAAGDPKTQPPVVARASVSITNPPAYHSRPGAPNVIYIDFNGAIVTNTSWNSSRSVALWDCGAWSTDTDSNNFSDAEQDNIRRIWERISEDYSSFDVDVTTDVAFDPDNYTGNKDKVGWLLITPTTDRNGVDCPHKGSGGIAYVSVYGGGSYSPNYQPAWVAPASAVNTAEAASHEMGHNMGLSHDGFFDGASDKRVYYGGHNGTASAPSWGPIMGTGYGRNMSQWSKGEYYNSAKVSWDGSQYVVEEQPHTQDDLSVISARVPYIPDDHGDTFPAATVWTEAVFSQTGLVETTDNPDYFAFTTGAGTISFTANPYRCDSGTWGGNLDIQLELYDSTFTLIASNNPVATADAAISETVASGDYYLVLRPVGAGTPTNASVSGYTSYGSLGQYVIDGNIIPADGVILTSPNGGESWVRGTTNTITWLSGMGGNVKIELLKNDVLYSTLAASTANDGAYDWAVPSDQTVATNYKMRVSSVETPAKTDTSLLNFTITVPPILVEDFDDSGSIPAGWTEVNISGSATWKVQSGGGASGGSNPSSAQSGSNNMTLYRADNGDNKRRLITPVFDTTGYDNLTLKFWHAQVEWAPDQDFLTVFFSTNSGSTWQVIGGWSNDTGWVERNIALPAESATSQIAFEGNAKWGYGVCIDTVSVSGDYTGGSGVIVTESGGSTAVAEGGATDTYTLVLGSPPTASVTVNIATNGQVTVDPASLTFTTGNWNQTQTVTVTAVDDGAHEFTHAGTITHTSTSGDAAFDNLAIDGVPVTITDNDNITPVVDAGTNQTVLMTGGTWSPTEIGGLSLWLDADDAGTLTLNGNGVASWQDKSGNNRNATQGTAASQPTDTAAGLNGKHVVTFDGSDDFLNVDLDFLAAVTHSAFIVTKTTVYSDIYGAAGPSAGANSLHVGFINSASYRMNYWGNDWNGAISTNFQAGNANLLNYLWTSGTDKEIFANGRSEGTRGSAGVIGTMSGGGRIGKVVNHVHYGGDIAEFIIVTGTVDVATREKFEGYLAHKWGLEGYLPGGHTYKSNGPSSAEASANLEGVVSDGDGDPLTTAWTVASGPGPVTFDDASATNAVAGFKEMGVYVLRLTADDTIAEASNTVTITVTNSIPMLDNDNDEMDDNWEAAHGLNNADPSDANGDADFDGVSNLEEFLMGTSPTNASQYLRIISVTIDGSGKPIVEWHSQQDGVAPPRSYTVQRLSSPISGSWVNVVTDLPAAGATTDHTDTTASENTGFYRIKPE